MSRSTEEQLTLSVDGVRIVLDPSVGGRATSWQVDGHELLACHGTRPVEHGMYAMAPWAGRLQGNGVTTPDGPHRLPATYGPWALHGTVLDQSVTVAHVERSEDRHEVALTTDDHPSWPWPMTVTMRWLLEPGQLTTQIEVHALAAPFPAVVGWHPWFRREVAGVRGAWGVEASGMLLRDEHHLPRALVAVPEEGPFDDAFVVPEGRATVTWPSVVDIEIRTDSTWCVVYDAPPEVMCIEPQSGPPDGLRDHPWWATTWARPGHPVTQTVRWRMRGRPADPA